MVVATGLHPELEMLLLCLWCLQGCLSHKYGVHQAEDLRLENGHKVLGIDELGIQVFPPKLQANLLTKPTDLGKMGLCDCVFVFESHSNEAIDQLEESVQFKLFLLQAKEATIRESTAWLVHALLRVKVWVPLTTD